MKWTQNDNGKWSVWFWIIIFIVWKDEQWTTKKYLKKGCLYRLKEGEKVGALKSIRTVHIIENYVAWNQINLT